MASVRALEAAARGALVTRADELGTVAITGRDRQTWLNGLVTSDLAKLAPGAASYGLALVKVGRIISDVWIVVAGDRLLAGVPRDRIAIVREHLERYLMMEDASHADVSDDMSWVFAHGPKSHDLVRTVPALHDGFGGTFDAMGIDGGAMVCPAGSVDALVADLVGGRDDVVEGTNDDWDALRVQQFVPRFGVDFGEKNYPQEASIERWAVSFSKGCYLGQEVVCRLEMRGHVNKKLVPVRLDPGAPPGVGAEVRSAEGKMVGSVSSAAAADGGPLALAMVRIDFAEPGTKLDVGGRSAVVLAPR